MAKKQKQPTHTYDELLKMAVTKCKETGGMPSRRSWTHDSFISFEELKQVLGKGDWNRAEKVIREAYLGANVQPDKAKPNAKGEKKMMSGELMRYQSYTTEDWVDWLHRLGGGRLLREESVRVRRSEQYDMIMEIFNDDWRNVERAFNRKYGKVPPKTTMTAEKEEPVETQKVVAPQHMPDELLALALQECVKQGKMLSDSKWMTAVALDFEEIVKVLGDGSWDLARRKIGHAWKQYEMEQDRVKKETVEAEAKTEPGVKVEPEPRTIEEAVEGAEAKADPAPVPEAFTRARNGRRLWTANECLDFLRREYEELGHVPTQKEINIRVAGRRGPAYTTLVKVLGEKSDWPKLLGIGLEAGSAIGPQDTEEIRSAEDPQDGSETPGVPEIPDIPEVPDEDFGAGAEVPETTEVAEAADGEEPAVAEEAPALSEEMVKAVVLVVHGAVIDVTLNGVRMKVQVDFGPAKEE